MTFSHAVFFCNDITLSYNVQNVPINEVADIFRISAIFKYLLLYMNLNCDCAIWKEKNWLTTFIGGDNKVRVP